VTIDAGQQLLHYRLIEKIGEGGMGVVWKATDSTLGREVAIKILPRDFAAAEDRLARFDREARLLASLNHPHIAGIYGIHKDKDEPETEEIQRLCAAFHLGPEVLAREAGSLSGGEKQRTALIRAHLFRPEFMLLDEPLANLDKESTAAISAWIAQQTISSTSLVIASHQPVHGLPNEKVRILEMGGGRLHERRD